MSASGKMMTKRTTKSMIAVLRFGCLSLRLMPLYIGPKIPAMTAAQKMG